MAEIWESVGKPLYQETSNCSQRRGAGADQHMLNRRLPWWWVW